MSKALIISILIVIVFISFVPKTFASKQIGEDCCNTTTDDYKCSSGILCYHNPLISGPCVGSVADETWGKCCEPDLSEPTKCKTVSNGGNTQTTGKVTIMECCKLRNKVDLGKGNVCGIGTSGDIAAPDKKASGACEGAGAKGHCDKSNQYNWGTFCLIDSIYTATNWIFVFALAITILMIIYGAFNLLTSAGDPKKTQTGKAIIIYAAIGFALALLAKIIPSIVKFLVNVQ